MRKENDYFGNVSDIGINTISYLDFCEMYGDCVDCDDCPYIINCKERRFIF